MTSRPLFDPGPATGNMSSREQIALDHITDHPEGVRSTVLGVHIHRVLAVPCGCGPNVICKWAMGDGERVGRQLRKRDLAIKRKASGRWQLIQPVRPVDDSDIPY